MKKLLAIVLMSTMCIHAHNQQQASIKTYTPFFKTRPFADHNQTLHALCTAKEKENVKRQEFANRMIAAWMKVNNT